MPGANMLRETADSIQCGVCNYHHAKGETRPMNADEIVRKLAGTNPWHEYGDVRETGGVPQFVCQYCSETRSFGTAAIHNWESCLWVAATRYHTNPPVVSQEPAQSPIESRVDELLSETR